MIIVFEQVLYSTTITYDNDMLTEVYSPVQFTRIQIVQGKHASKTRRLINTVVMLGKWVSYDGATAGRNETQGTFDALLNQRVPLSEIHARQSQTRRFPFVRSGTSSLCWVRPVRSIQLGVQSMTTLHLCSPHLRVIEVCSPVRMRLAASMHVPIPYPLKLFKIFLF